MEAILALEDGRTFKGNGFSAGGEAYGEVVFNTSMMGYQEILTDPSYKGQIVTMTYPLIGNYGVNEKDFESRRPYAEGFVVKESSTLHNNWRAQGGLGEFLKKYNIIGIEGIDTRALTKHLRTYGAKKGVISTVDLDEKRLVEKAKASPGLVGRDLIKEVTCPEPYDWNEGEFTFAQGQGEVKQNYKVVVLDCGVKHNILRKLVSRGCQVKVVPATTSAKDMLAMEPDGIVLSNGPGDPEGIPYVIENVRGLLGKVPVFGICLGHQVLGLAFHGKTYKLKFGHRGGNQPVLNLENKKVEITAQNHGFAVDMNSIPDKDVILTHINLNDKTAEGLRHRKLPVFSIQYHPEASPGPHDAGYLFDRFIEMMAK